MKLDVGEMNAKAVFVMCLADPAGVIFSEIWPLPHTQKIFKNNSNMKSDSLIALCSLSEIVDVSALEMNCKEPAKIYHFFNIILLLFFFSLLDNDEKAQ